MLTSRVMTNSTRPEAISASMADLAGVAELVRDVGGDGVAAGLQDLSRHGVARGEHQGDGDGLAERPAEAEHEALMTPERPKGSTDRRMISQRVAPSASAASTWARGTCRKTSREIAAMIGRIITARTTPV